MVRHLVVVSLILSVAMVAGCGKEESAEIDTEEAAKAAEKEATALKAEIEQLIKDGKLAEAEKKLMLLESKEGLPDSWKDTCKALKAMIDAAKAGGGITLPKIGG